jgi:hypothetical protein
MADNKLLQQMLEHLVNDDQAKAEELFHEYVVTASREIYESLIDSEIAEEEEKDADDEDEDKMKEAAKDDDAENDKVDEEFDDIAIEGDDEMPSMGGDPTDDLEGDIDAEIDDEEGGEKSEEELFQDLDSIVDELQAKFDELKGGDGMGDDGEEGGNPFAKEEGMGDLATVREYVEKVANGHGAEKKGAGEGALVGTGNKGQGSATNAQGMKFSKNDMGGTTANILSGRNGAPGSETGELKGSGLLKGKPTEDNAGNINVPGGKAGGAFSKKEPGHGAEKAGAKESPDNKQSLFRGRR